MVGVQFVEDDPLLGDPLGVPVERRMLGQVPVLVRVVLHQNLIHDELVDRHPHQRQRAQRAGRLGGHHPFGGQHQVRADPRGVGQQLAEAFGARGDPLQQLDDARRRGLVAASDSLRCRGQARSRYSPKVAGRVSMRIASAVDAQSTTT